MRGPRGAVAGSMERRSSHTCQAGGNWSAERTWRGMVPSATTVASSSRQSRHCSVTIPSSRSIISSPHSWVRAMNSKARSSPRLRLTSGPQFVEQFLIDLREAGVSGGVVAVAFRLGPEDGDEVLDGELAHAPVRCLHGGLQRGMAFFSWMGVAWHEKAADQVGRRRTRGFGRLLSGHFVVSVGAGRCQRLGHSRVAVDRRRLGRNPCWSYGEGLWCPRGIFFLSDVCRGCSGCCGAGIRGALEGLALRWAYPPAEAARALHWVRTLPLTR